MTEQETFLDGRVTLHRGECLSVLTGLPENSVDSVVTDPPYHLTSIVKRFGGDGAAEAKEGATGAFKRASAGFMGKQWDGGDIAFRPEVWNECLRVLKPGGYLLAFGGTRTYHRLACAIEDGGFDVRDAIMWHYGSGFPKNHNISNRIDRCDCAEDLRDLQQGMVANGRETSTSENMRSDVPSSSSVALEEGQASAQRSATDAELSPVRDEIQNSKGVAEEKQERLLQPNMSSKACDGTDTDRERPQGTGRLDGQEREIISQEDERPKEPGLEGRGDVSEASRQLRERQARSVPGSSTNNGEGGWLRDAASTGNGGMDRQAVDQNGVRASQGSRSTEQQPQESGTVAVQSQPQDGRAWPHCGRCGKPIIPDGLGTALKPATEIIAFARKPISEKTNVDNILKWGTVALNIDGCRIDAEKPTGWGGKAGGGGTWTEDNCGLAKNGAARPVQGRWPTNLIHDGSDEVVAAFPDAPGQQTGLVYGKMNRHGEKSADARYSDKGSTNFAALPGMRRGDSGSAARFFYSAKADAEDRIGSKHPTVKPVNLMQYLVRLVTPPGGTVLNPFAGTGTTGEAAWREGFSAVLIEREPKYCADITERVRLCLSGPDEKRREIIKRKGQANGDAGPLFGAAS